mmetsp:Transcript_39036/g.95455  ORF Transcript_39036/g.95455 Transcript_39036/m.95455 type:complete len:208 (+) Transcript_39036:114-737(+)
MARTLSRSELRWGGRCWRCPGSALGWRVWRWVERPTSRLRGRYCRTARRMGRLCWIVAARMACCAMTATATRWFWAKSPRPRAKSFSPCTPRAHRSCAPSAARPTIRDTMRQQGPGATSSCCITLKCPPRASTPPWPRCTSNPKCHKSAQKRTKFIPLARGKLSKPRWQKLKAWHSQRASRLRRNRKHKTTLLRLSPRPQLPSRHLV